MSPEEIFNLTLLSKYQKEAPKKLNYFLIKAKLKQSPANNVSPPKKVTCCNNGHCRTCKFIAHGTSSYTFHNTGEQIKIFTKSILLFQQSGLLNQLQTDPTLPCQCIGQTSHILRECFLEHIRGIENSIDESAPIHLNQPKHTLNDLHVILLLYANSSGDSTMIRKQCEEKKM